MWTSPPWQRRSARQTSFDVLSFPTERTSPCSSLSVTVFLRLVITRFAWEPPQSDCFAGLANTVRGNRAHRLHQETSLRLVKREQESIALHNLSREDVVSVTMPQTRSSVSSAPPFAGRSWPLRNQRSSGRTHHRLACRSRLLDVELVKLLRGLHHSRHRALGPRTNFPPGKAVALLSLTFSYSLLLSLALSCFLSLSLSITLSLTHTNTRKECMGLGLFPVW